MNQKLGTIIALSICIVFAIVTAFIVIIVADWQLSTTIAERRLNPHYEYIAYFIPSFTISCVAFLYAVGVFKNIADCNQTGDKDAT